MIATLNPRPRIDVPPTVRETLAPDERAALREQCRELLRANDAVLVAHYYTAPEIQELADDTGGYVSDSLDMARFGHEHPAATLVVAGVRFMGETAKILNPEKRVLMPDLAAECSLDLGCPPDEFSAFCDAHPDRTVVVYANTSAAVKARADWMVTSGSALDVVRHLDARGEKILWAPDRYLGEYVQTATGADMPAVERRVRGARGVQGRRTRRAQACPPGGARAGASGIAGAGGCAGRLRRLDLGPDQRSP